MSMGSEIAYDYVIEICHELQKKYNEDATLTEEQKAYMIKALNDLIKRVP